MNRAVQDVVVVGGGTAGWIAAGVLAAKQPSLKVTLVESPDIRTIGVGEGTWPSMKDTLKIIGVSEEAFIRACGASYKQGSRFNGWIDGDVTRYYYHPFTPPMKYGELNLAQAWSAGYGNHAFSDVVCPQSAVCEHDLAPKNVGAEEYSSSLNYGYHLDAAKFANFLKEHCVANLGVSHVVAGISRVVSDDQGYISALVTDEEATLAGDFFIDCTGFAGLLIDKHFQVPFKSMRQFLPNDSALAIQVPYASPSAEIKSCTESTALPFGWVWNIGLQDRKGMGYVYSSQFQSDDQAAADFEAFLTARGESFSLSGRGFKKIKYEPGYREQFWVKNCVALGMSSGFIEPLEASALVMIEMGIKFVAEQFPADFIMMEVLSKRYNTRFERHWNQIIEFLKLHYVLSQRADSAYWLAQKLPESIPENLSDLLTLWQYQSPWRYDAQLPEELFSPASYQFVLYGMLFKPKSLREQVSAAYLAEATRLFKQNREKTNQLLSLLPTNRSLLGKLYARVDVVN